MERSLEQLHGEDSKRRTTTAMGSQRTLNSTNHQSGQLFTTTTPVDDADAAEHILNLTGVTNVLIPVSTLDLFFKRFDMIERQLDDLKSLGNRGLVSPCLSTAPPVVDSESSDELATRVSTLEKTLVSQNNLLDELNNRCKLLLEQNNELKDTLKNNLNCKQCSDRARTTNMTQKLKSRDSGSNASVNLDVSASQPHPSASVCAPETRSRPISDSDHELVITNIIRDCEFDHKKTALTVLRSVLPSISAEDVVSCRLAARKDRNSPNIKNNTRAPPLFVGMKTKRILNKVIAAKKKINLLNTCDLDLSALGQIDSSNIINSNIYISRKPLI